jgi:hypothetical protein
MELEELRQKSYTKTLLRGKSGRGKTYNCCKVAMMVSEMGGDVLYVDTESEGSTTMLNLVEGGEFDEDSIQNIEYEQVTSYDEFKSCLDERMGDYDLVVIDTLDHKHSFVIKEVTDAKRESDADWNEYATIYSEEKEVMERIGKPESHILATIDPESGKSEKPKGAQTNIVGYFSIVVDMKKSSDGWKNPVKNYVGDADKIGESPTNLAEHIAEKIMGIEYGEE